MPWSQSLSWRIRKIDWSNGSGHLILVTSDEEKARDTFDRFALGQGDYISLDRLIPDTGRLTMWKNVASRSR